jgi:hypothetical protein
MVTVTFNTNGGNAIENKTYQADGLSYSHNPNTGLPTPTGTGGIFDTWCSDIALTQAVSDATAVPSANHTLYARWIQTPTVILAQPANNAPKSYSYFVDNGQLTINNGQWKAGDVIEVYNMQGKLVHSVKVHGIRPDVKIPVQTKGIYVVKINKVAFRVAVM